MTKKISERYEGERIQDPRLRKVGAGDDVFPGRQSGEGIEEVQVLAQSEQTAEKLHFQGQQFLQSQAGEDDN